MHLESKILLAMLIVVGAAAVVDADCQPQSASALKKMLLSAGGTLNPQMVAINLAGAMQFRSHFSRKVRRVSVAMDKKVAKDFDDFEDDDDDDDDIIEKQETDDISDENDNVDDVDRDVRRSRRRRSVTIGSCYGPGAALNGMHLLCHICDSTTMLSSDYFPQYVNEVICNPNKSQYCFQGQGQCAANSVPIVFLKKTGNCVASGSGILLQEWQPETRYVRTCCECRLFPNSYLIPLTL